MSQVPLAATATGQTLQMVDFAKVLEIIRTQIEKGWGEGKPIQLDLNDIHRALEEAGIPLPEDSRTIDKVESFVLSVCTLLGWQTECHSNDEDWWIEIII